METFLAFLATGAVAGVLAGLFGVGGGLIMVPALALLLPRQGVPDDLRMHLAIGTSLAVVACTSISSTLAHHRRGSVAWAAFRFLAPGLSLGALVGSLLADELSSETLRRIVGGGALLLAVQIAFGGQPKPSASTRPPAALELFGVGGLIGALSSLIGIGGGSLTVPYLTLRGSDVRRAVGTAAAGGIPIAWAGALGFIYAGYAEPGLPPWSLGYVSLQGFVGLAVTSALTAPLGARLAHKLPPAALKRAFALLLLAVGLKMVAG